MRGSGGSRSIFGFPYAKVYVKCHIVSYFQSTRTREMSAYNSAIVSVTFYVKRASFFYGKKPCLDIYVFKFFRYCTIAKQQALSLAAPSVNIMYSCIHCYYSIC